MPLWKAILKRTLLYTALFVATVSFIYVLARLIPGDPVTVLYGEMAEDRATRDILEQQLGLDRPIYIQLLTYMGNIFTGRWGKSIYTGEGVVSIISRSFTASLKLASLSTLLVLAICSAALYIEYGYGLNGRLLTTVSSLLSSMPTVVWGAVLLLILTQLRQPIVLGDTVPPLIVLTLVATGIFYRLFKSAIEYSYQQPFIETYAMMGYSRVAVFLKALRYSLPTILSALLYRAGLIIAGAIVVETMFLYPGMGLVFYVALASRDYPVLIGWGVAVSATLIGINLTVDIVHSIADPRVVQQWSPD